MNILFYLHKYPEIGGIERVTTSLANAFVERGLNVSIFSFVGQDSSCESFVLDKRVTIVRSLSSDPNSPEAKASLENVIRDKAIDVVINQDSNAEIEAPLFSLKQQYGFKVITCLHSSPNNKLAAFDNTWRPSSVVIRMLKPVLRHKAKKSIKQRYQFQYTNSDCYVLLSALFKEQWCNMSGIKDAERLTSINNPITIEEQNSYTDFSGKKNQCVFCGRLGREKGVYMLLEAWNKTKTADDWELIIVGDGPEKQNMINYIATHGIRNVKMVGSCTDPSAYYRDAKIITMASYFEGWLLSLSEAMNYGCVPILFNSYLSAKDIVRSDSEGVLVKPFDIEEYAKRLTDLIQDEEHLKTMSYNAYCSSKRFSIDNIVDQWMKLFNLNPNANPNL